MAKVNKTKKVANSKEVDNKKDKKAMSKVKNILNNPLPMLIALTIIIVVLLIYISTTSRESKIYVGEINEEDVNIVNIHYFANNDMNYFYASNAAYLGSDEKVYSFQVGYYAVDAKGEYHELATRSQKLDKATSIRDVVTENSGWSISELANPKLTNGKKFFDNDVLNNLENLHFVILASTDKEKPNDPDIKVDYKISLTKLTK
ncbi:MAG: hypothetical protein J5982_05095 [Bacilli bacterium]|nr:hypothetical protein [Bacilli bacterium]